MKPCLRDVFKITRSFVEMDDPQMRGRARDMICQKNFPVFSCLVKTSFEAFCLEISFSEGKIFHIPPDAFLAIEC